jgi:hypothetical protein
MDIKKLEDALLTAKSTAADMASSGSEIGLAEARADVQAAESALAAARAAKGGKNRKSGKSRRTVKKSKKLRKKTSRR